MCKSPKDEKSLTKAKTGNLDLDQGWTELWEGYSTGLSGHEPLV
jgi:hypothetical protein